MSTCHTTSNRSSAGCIAYAALFALLGCLFLAGCEPEKEASGQTASPDTYFPIGIGPRTLQLQLALTPAEHQKGLMFREELAEDHGMLFLFKRPARQGFWMKNTGLRLDIGYFDPGGRLQEIHKLFPYNETAVVSRSQRILMAVETNRGWYAGNGIGPGAQLDIEALKAAIVKRGFSPETYAIED